MNEERFLARLMEIIRIDSPSKEEKKMSDYLASYFQKEGLEVSVDKSGKIFGSDGGNVLVHIPGTLPLDAICFNAHMDTVEPGRGIEPILEEGRLKSRGDTILGADDKAGIAMMIEAYNELKEKKTPHREIYFLFTIGEEIMRGAAAYDTSNIRAKYMFILDGAGHPQYLCQASKGKTFLTYEFIGEGAHAGVNLEEGINAVCMAADAVVNIRQLIQETSRENKDVNQTTVNISSFHGGEEAPTVPDFAKVTVEIRSFSQKELEKMVERMNEKAYDTAEKYGGTVRVSVESVCRPYHAETDEYLYCRTKEAIVQEGFHPIEVKTGGSSDGNIFGERGFLCSGLGIGIYKVHTTEEYMELEEAKAAYRILLDMMIR